MPLFLIAFGGMLKRAAFGLIGWLSKRSLIELACIALALCLVVQTFRQMDAAHDRDAWQRNAKSCADARKADSTARNEQKAETSKRIEGVKEKIRHADDRAKVIEAAPLPGNCKSPEEVLDADI